MPDKQPIQLDYKTPEKGERVTTMTVFKRVMVGFCGMIALIATLILIAAAAQVSNRNVGNEFVLFLIIPTCITSIFAIRWLKDAFIGARKSQKSSTESDK